MLHPSLRAIDAANGATRGPPRRRPDAHRLRLLAGPRRHATRDHARAQRRAASGDVGRGDGPSSDLELGALSGRSNPSTGGRTPRRSCCCSSSRGGTCSTATTSPRERSRPSTPTPGRSRRRSSGRTARSGTGSTTGEHPARILAAGTARPSRARWAARTGRPRFRDAGVPRTPTASVSTGSSSAPEGDGPYPVPPRARRTALR